ncbi:MAG: hypothetical protein ACI837_001394 [Crocinitomicaceae bacterium]|jgi:hypothetical protein
MKRATIFPTKTLPFFIVITLSFSCLSQEIAKKSRLGIEVSGGYEYSFLEDFNEELVRNQFADVFSHDLNSGWSISASPTFQFNRFLNAGIDITYRSYHISGFKSDLFFADLEIGGPSFSYDIQRDIHLNNLGFGIKTTIYFDQLRDKREDSKFNFGLDLKGNYVRGKYKNVQTLYNHNENEGNANTKSAKFNYWTFRVGLTMKRKFDKHIFRSIILKSGWNQSINAEVPITNIFGEYEKLKVDLSGFYIELCIELGWPNKK